MDKLFCYLFDMPKVQETSNNHSLTRESLLANHIYRLNHILNSQHLYEKMT